MSIIEKAAGKLGETVKPIQPASDGEKIARDRDEKIIEAAINREKLGDGVKSPMSGQPPAEPQRGPTPRLPEQASRHENINLAKLRQAGMITPDGERSQIAEQFRLIKRPLIMNAFNQGAAPVKNGNLIMVTSSFPGEGKSFCSINLAMSIAMEMDHRVLLVDADVAKPSIPKFFGFKADKGIMDVLLDEHVQLSDVLIRTNVEKLSILPAGRGHRYATELLASEAMNRLLRDMAQRYQDRIIIFDSPPLLSTTEARVLATHMGQIVMIVEAQRTTHEALKEALRQIESCDVVSLLLNKGNALTGADYYGYGQYGGYGK
ncbi:MAG: tyrosine-protein kinase family protein [Gammaproteobacteria bacterium]|nr:tyrosine-protein kinase family protein [Gammaproteobacteria bacterium]